MSKKTGDSDCFAFEQELTLMKKYFFFQYSFGVIILIKPKGNRFKYLNFS